LIVNDNADPHEIRDLIERVGVVFTFADELLPEGVTSLHTRLNLDDIKTFVSEKCNQKLVYSPLETFVHRTTVIKFRGLAISQIVVQRCRLNLDP
jgi:hypothetical protein